MVSDETPIFTILNAFSSFAIVGYSSVSVQVYSYYKQMKQLGLCIN